VYRVAEGRQAIPVPVPYPLAAPRPSCTKPFRCEYSAKKWRKFCLCIMATGL